MKKKMPAHLKITAKLVDGRFVSTDGIIMLDSIIYHGWFSKYHPETLETGKWMTNHNIHIGLPITQYDNRRVYAASKAIYTPIATSVEYWNKRPDFFNADKINYLDMKKGLISDSVGGYRAYRSPMIVHTVKDNQVFFYCRGNKNKIEDLLSYIPAIGKKNRQGYGLIKEWAIEEIEEDYSLAHQKYGLLRPIPVNARDMIDIVRKSGVDLLDYPVMDYACKPPYYKSVNVRSCYVPWLEE